MTAMIQEAIPDLKALSPPSDPSTPDFCGNSSTIGERTVGKVKLAVPYLEDIRYSVRVYFCPLFRIPQSSQTPVF